MNRGRSKILACFKPVGDNDHGPGCETASPPSSGDEAGGGRRIRLGRSFSTALKAVLFKTSLLKKSRSENNKQDCDGLSRNKLYTKSKKLVNTMKKNLSGKPYSKRKQNDLRTNSGRSPLFSSSSSSSSRSHSLASSSSNSSCSSHSGSDKIKRSASLDFGQMNKQKTMKRDSCRRKCSNSFTLEMCVLLVCLIALVWGKVFAVVVCTSMWLFFAPASRRHRRRSHQPLRRCDSFDLIDSEEYKKRVIMEGFLERNR